MTYLRPATEGDATELLRWRNDPVTRHFRNDPRVVSHDEHIAWLTRRQVSDSKVYVFDAPEPVGNITLNVDARGTEIGWIIAPEHRRRGLARQMLLAAIETIIDRSKPVWAKIRIDNTSSIQLALSCGFQPRTVEQKMLYLDYVGCVVKQPRDLRTGLHRNSMDRNGLGADRNGLDRLLRAPSVETLRAELQAQEPLLGNGDIKTLAILGVGPEGKRLADICRSRGIEIVGAYDGNVRMRGTRFAGMRIYPSEALTRLPRDIPIVIASHRVLGAYELLRAQGYVAVPIAYLQVAAPQTFTPHAFYDGLLEDLVDHRQQYLQLSEMMADEQSRATLSAIIAYRLTLNPLYLRDLIDWNLYDALNFSDDEVYVDGGTYNGDFIHFFTDHVGNRYERIFAFEPDKETFKTLAARFGNNPRTELHNAGLHSHSGKIGFTSDSSRAAKIDPDGKSQIDVVSLDDVIPGRVSFIKLNIEGAEIEALKGGRKLIGRYTPKLAISAYHRPSDLWQIPKLIKELNTCYKLYLRQQDGGIIESVIYARTA